MVVSVSVDPAVGDGDLAVWVGGASGAVADGYSGPGGIRDVTLLSPHKPSAHKDQGGDRGACKVAKTVNCEQSEHTICLVFRA